MDRDLTQGIINCTPKKTRPHQTKMSYFTCTQIALFLIFFFSCHLHAPSARHQRGIPMIPHSDLILFTLSLQFCVQLGRDKKICRPLFFLYHIVVRVVYSELITHPAVFSPLPSFTFVYMYKCIHENAKLYSTQKT